MLLANPIGFLFAIIERRNTMQFHAIKTGTVAVKTRQQQGGRGSGALRLMNTMLDPTWTDPLPIYAWVIDHPEGLIVIDTGETARTAEPGYFPWWHPYFKLGVKEFVTAELSQHRNFGVSAGIPTSCRPERAPAGLLAQPLAGLVLAPAGRF
jgi:hypothetical protein